MIPLVAPSHDARDEHAVRDGLAAALADPGAVVASLVSALGRVTGTVGGVATASGTSALVVALRALGVGPGDLVAAPSYTCLAVHHAVREVGASLILLDNVEDVEALDHNLDVDRALDRLTGATALRAVIVPFAFGTLVDTGPLRELGVPVIADAAMALGATIADQPLGTLGDVVTLSLHASKLVSAGTGGAALSLDPAMVARLAHVTGWQEQLVADRLAEATSVAGTAGESVSAPMSALAALLGRSQLGKLPEFLARRREITTTYASAFEDLPVRVPRNLASDAVVHRHVLRLGDGLDPVTLVRQFAERGIEAGRGVFPALHHYLGEPGWETSCAERSTRHNLSLPVHPGLSDAQVEQIVAAGRDLFVGTR